MSSKEAGIEFSDDLLGVYYRLLFPYRAMFNWLSYGNDPESQSELVDRTFFPNREISFTLKDDVYIRYKSFTSLAEFRKTVQSNRPYKMDIGAVFNAPPKMKEVVDGFKPVQRELVFDIDISDYDDVRSCCQGASICHACWPLMNCAIKVVDKALREDFGFEHLFWVFSGRRGVHCWVCDKSAREAPNDLRSAVTDYLSLVTGSEHNATKIDFKSREAENHFSLIRAYETCEPYFRSIFLEGKHNPGPTLLDDPSRRDAVLSIMRNRFQSITKSTLRQTAMDFWIKVKKEWCKDNNSCKKWDAFVKLCEVHGEKSLKELKLELVRLQREIVFSFVYPRLDANVSKQMNHLLKSPFVAHPKTGKVCVPIDPEKCDEFDPMDQPTLRSLNEELNADTDDMDTTADNEEGQPPAESGSTSKQRHTSLEAHVVFFEKEFVDKLLKANLEERKALAGPIF